MSLNRKTGARHRDGYEAPASECHQGPRRRAHHRPDILPQSDPEFSSRNALACRGSPYVLRAGARRRRRPARATRARAMSYVCRKARALPLSGFDVRALPRRQCENGGAQIWQYILSGPSIVAHAAEPFGSAPRAADVVPGARISCDSRRPSRLRTAPRGGEFSFSHSLRGSVARLEGLREEHLDGEAIVHALSAPERVRGLAVDVDVVLLV